MIREKLFFRILPICLFTALNCYSSDEPRTKKFKIFNPTQTRQFRIDAQRNADTLRAMFSRAFTDNATSQVTLSMLFDRYAVTGREFVFNDTFNSVVETASAEIFEMYLDYLHNLTKIIKKRLAEGLTDQMTFLQFVSDLTESILVISTEALTVGDTNLKQQTLAHALKLLVTLDHVEIADLPSELEITARQKILTVVEKIQNFYDPDNFCKMQALRARVQIIRRAPKLN
ncbi:MAG: hypothetical protein AB7F43_06080 [Bacteriovoracia bacterium]